MFRVTILLETPRYQSTQQDAMMSITVSPISAAGTKLTCRTEDTRTRTPVEILGITIIELGLSHHENAVRPRQSARINTAGIGESLR
jgi:hypothetical protein